MAAADMLISNVRPGAIHGRRVWVPVMDIAGTAELSQKNRPAVQMESKHIPVQTVEVPIRK